MGVRKPVSMSVALAAVSLVHGRVLGDTHRWIEPYGAVFNKAAYWSPVGVPGEKDAASFDLSGAYTVRFGSAVTHSQLLIGDDKVDFDLGRYTYDLTSANPAAIYLGLAKGDVSRIGFLTGVLRSGPAVIGGVAGSDANITVYGGSTWTNSGLLSVGGYGSGGLTITGGGKLVSEYASVGVGGGARGDVFLSSGGSRWDVSGGLTVGGKGTGQVIIRKGSTVAVGGALDIKKRGTVRLEGGTLEAASINRAGAFSFVSGTLNLIDSSLVIGSEGPLGALVNLKLGQVLRVGKNASLAADGELGIEDSLYSGNRVENRGQIRLSGAKASLVNKLLRNYKTIDGSGRFAGEVRNYPGGVIEVLGEGGMLFDDPVGNAGAIDIVEGSVGRFKGLLVNIAGGSIGGEGSLVAEAGLANAGEMSFNDGPVSISGVAVNRDGGTIAAHGQLITFAGGFIHSDGVVDVGPESGVIFEGEVSGGGDFGGSGKIAFNSTYSPGNSAADVSLGKNNVSFGSGGRLVMELGGVTRGTEYDHLDVDGLINLTRVDVELTNDFVPEVGDSFELITGAVAYGANFQINVPVLGGLHTFRVTRTSESLQVDVVIIPEPAGGLLLVVGLAGLVGRRGRRLKHG